MRFALRKGVPSLFLDLKSLYASIPCPPDYSEREESKASRQPSNLPPRVRALDTLIKGYLHALSEEGGCVFPSSSFESVRVGESVGAPTLLARRRVTPHACSVLTRSPCAVPPEGVAGNVLVGVDARG